MLRFSNNAADTLMEDEKFDTLKLSQNLEAAGVPNGQAKAIAAGIRDARAGLVTKADLDTGLAVLESRLDAKLAALRADLFRALWIQGAGLVAIILAAKLF